MLSTRLSDLALFSRTVSDLRRRFDFSLRAMLGFSLPFRPIRRTPPIQAAWAREVDDFLDLFDWKAALGGAKRSLRVADIGARHFALAPRLATRFTALGYSPELHGIEVDAHRRLADGRTQAEYGAFHAGLAGNAHFHSMDFVDFEKPLDLALLLHPFVTEQALAAWGLPLRFLRPTQLFARLRESLGEKGVLVACTPTAHQKNELIGFATKAGFVLEEARNWLPSQTSLQKQPRLGMRFRVAD